MSRATETRVRKLEASASEAANDRIPIFHLDFLDGEDFETTVNKMIASGELQPGDRPRCISWKDYPWPVGTHEDHLKRLGVHLMGAGIAKRLRKLEAARPAGVPVYVWGDSEAEWPARKQEMIANGRASENAQFVFMRWLGEDDDVKQAGAA